MQAGSIALEPFVGLAYVNYGSDTGKEKGGAAVLKVKSSQDVTFSTVGLRAGQRITLGNFLPRDWPCSVAVTGVAVCSGTRVPCGAASG